MNTLVGEHIRVLPPCEKYLNSLLKQYEAKFEEMEDVPLSDIKKLALSVRRDLLRKILDQRNVEKVATKHTLWERYKDLVLAQIFDSVYDRAWFRMSEHAKPP